MITTSPRPQYPAEARVWAVVVVCGLTAWLVAFSTQNVAVQGVAWGTALALTGLAIAFGGAQGFDVFSPRFFVGMSFAVFYGASAVAISVKEQFSRFSQVIQDSLEYLPYATAISFMALAGFLFGYSTLWRALALRGARILDMRASSRALHWFWAVLFSAGAAYFLAGLAFDMYYQVTEDLVSPLVASAFGFLLQGLVIAVPLAIAEALVSGKLFWRIAAVLSSGVLLAFGIPTGSKLLALLGLLLPAMAINYFHRRVGRGLAVALMLAGMVLAVVFFPLTVQYRETLVASGGLGAPSLAQSAYAVATAIGDLEEGGLREYGELAADYLTARLSNVAVVANILRLQDHGLDYEWGETYMRFAYAFIPRLLWPDKPAISLANQLTVVLGYADPEGTVLGRETSTTALGITLVGEFVYNFPGLLAALGFTLLGMLYRWTYETFLRAAPNAPGLAIGIYAVWWFGLIVSGHESNFAGVFSGVIKVTLLALALLWLIRGLTPTPRPA